MQYSENLKLNLPERNDQFNIDDWNENTNNLDELIYQNQLNISQNQSDISEIFNGLGNKNVDDANSVYYKLMKLIYPVGSLYWSSNNTNPSQLFGGTWSQIKDKFILSAGDTYNNNDIGGSATVTLTINQIPSHTHTGPSHTHSFTPSGTISSHTHTIEHTHTRGTMEITGYFSGFRPQSANIQVSGAFYSSMESRVASAEGMPGVYYNSNINMKASRSWTGNTSSPDKGVSGEAQPEFTGTAGTTSSISQGVSGEAQPEFTGTAGTTESAGNGNTGSTGSSQSHNNMPPYIVKYCWERTA